MNSIQIHKSSPAMSALVQRWNGAQFEAALNWKELADEAMQSITPELRRRWLAYWNSVAVRASIAQEATDVNEMLKTIALPSPYYPCPEYLAAKAIWPSPQPAPFLLIEADS
jgi:hypothetical protein